MAPLADGGVQGVVTTTRSAGHTITYSFVADRPVTFTYHECYGVDCASCLVVGVQGIDAGVPRRVKRPAADSRTGRPARIAVPVARSSRGMACVEAQSMANCPVIYYDGAGYGGHPPLQQLLRWLGGRTRTDAAGRGRKRGESHARIAVPWPWSSANEPASAIAQITADSHVLHYDAAEYGNHPVFWRLLRLSGEVLGAAALWVSGICGRRDLDVRRPGDGPMNLWVGGPSNPHISLAPYFATP